LKRIFLDVINNDYFFILCERRDKAEINAQSSKKKKLSINKIKFEYYLFLKTETAVIEKELRHNYFSYIKNKLEIFIILHYVRF